MNKLLLALTLLILLTITTGCGMSGASFSASGSSSSGSSSSGGSSSGSASSGSLPLGGTTTGGSSTPSAPAEGDINPEPATLAMFGIGLSGLALAAARRKKR